MSASASNSVSGGTETPRPGPNAPRRDARTEQVIARAYAARGENYVARTDRLNANGYPRYINRLILERSPYLLQHAHNPVDWRAWNTEAFAAAKAWDRPIFLSVGYATCHWCHVMEVESFDDKDVALAMNGRFVPIKVDREELPDVDLTYMRAAMFVTQRGGWPNSVWLTPDGRPFFAGSYFTKEQFLNVLNAIDEGWCERRQEVEEQANQLSEAIRAYARADEGLAQIGPETTQKAIDQLAGIFNQKEGGFSQGTQFPNEPLLAFLIDSWRREGSVLARRMAVFTLAALESGGIHDHVGGGFHRYTVDVNWRTPHFEKMLYNQAQILRLLIEAAMLPGTANSDGAERLIRAAARLIGYVIDDMQAPDGAFYTAEDADSATPSGQLVEGAFYVWDEAGVRAALGEGVDAAVAIENLGLNAPATLENAKVAHFPRGLPIDLQRLDPVLDKMKAARTARARPLRDEKIIAGWNGLMIRALAEAAGPIGSATALLAAQRAADAVWARLWRNGELHRIGIDAGETEKDTIAARLDDLAWMGLGVLSLSEAIWDDNGCWESVTLWRSRAVEIADVILSRYVDRSGRLKLAQTDGPLGPVFETDDGASPAGESSAIELFARLDRSTEDPKFGLAAKRVLSAISKRMNMRPAERPTALIAASILREGESGLRRTIGRGVARAILLPNANGEGWRLRLSVAPGWRVQNATITVGDKHMPQGAEGFFDITPEEGEMARLSVELCEGDRCIAPEITHFRVGCGVG
jgi:uncharacterized protein YyaL (SSP411 family)